MPRRKRNLKEYKVYLWKNSETDVPYHTRRRDEQHQQDHQNVDLDQSFNGPLHNNGENVLDQSENGSHEEPDNGGSLPSSNDDFNVREVHTDDQDNLTLPDHGGSNPSDSHESSNSDPSDSDSSTSSGGESPSSDPDSSSDSSEPDESLNSEDSEINSESDNEDLLDAAKFMRDKYQLDLPLLDLPVSSTLSKFEVLLMLFEMVMRQSLSNVALLDLFKFVNIVINAQVIPESLFLYDKVFEGDLKVEYHFYCSKCSRYHGSLSYFERLGIQQCLCRECNTACRTSKSNFGNFFITIPLRYQVKLFLEKTEDIQEHLKKRFNREPSDFISDMLDGEYYQELMDSGHITEDDVTITISTDGTPVKISEKNTMWPIQFRFNEVPPSKRHSKENMFIAGLWFGEKDPKMQVFLKQFAQEAHDLFTNGVEWRNKHGVLIKSRVIVLNCCLDSVAKAMVQCVKQFNSFFGCLYCYHPTNPTPKGRRYLVREVEFDEPDDPNYLDRDYDDYFFEGRRDEEIEADMFEAHHTNREVRGVKGLSPLIVLPGFHMVYGFVIDYMHGVLLGVTKQLASIWFTECGEDPRRPPDFYIKSKMKTVSSRLKKLKPPSSIKRRPRNIERWKKYKANEWRSFLLYYGVPCLQGLLPDRYLKHFALLVSATYIFLKKSVTRQEIKLGENYLKEFVVHFQALYGEEQMVYNVHLLSHLGQCVRLWGPLWCYSAFSFESGIGDLKKLVKGTTGVLSQIASKYLKKIAIGKVKTLYTISNGVNMFCDELKAIHKVSHVEYFEGSVLLGKPEFNLLDDDEVDLLTSAHINDPPQFCYGRLIQDGIKYHSRTYHKSKKSDDTIVTLSDGSVACITRIFVYDEEVHVLVRSVNLSNHPFVIHPLLGACVQHIKVCEPYAYGDLKRVRPGDIVKKSILLGIDNNVFITDFPNTYETD